MFRIFVVFTITFFANIVSADNIYDINIHNNRFEPEIIKVPKHTKFKLRVHNMDDIVEEFESHSLKREKIIPPGKSVIISFGMLESGEYEFFGDFHQDTAQGKILVE